MTHTVKRRRVEAEAESSGQNLLSLLMMVALAIATIAYVFPALTSGDWLWFSSQFDARPRLITVVDRGQRTEIGPDDPRFPALVDAFNTSISSGYYHASMGFSDDTWSIVDRNGLLVEAVYDAPVRLHVRGGFEPTRRLRILVAGKDIHTTQILFRSNEADWDPIPMVVDDVAPLEAELSRHGFGT